MLGAACRHLHPHHCRPPPTQPHQRWRPCRLASFSSPPCDPPPVAVAPSPPSRLPMAPSLTGMWRRCALPPGPTRQVPLPHAPPSLGYGPIAPAPPSLSGGRRYTLLRFSGRRRRSGDGDGSTATLMVVHGNSVPRQRHCDNDTRPSWSSLSSVGIVRVRCGWVVVVFVGCFVECVVVSFVGCVCCRGMRSVMSYVCSLYQIT